MQKLTRDKFPLSYLIGYWPFLALQKVSVFIRMDWYSLDWLLVKCIFYLCYTRSASETYLLDLRCKNSFLRLGIIVYHPCLIRVVKLIPIRRILVLLVSSHKMRCKVCFELILIIWLMFGVRCKNYERSGSLHLFLSFNF